jgi:cyclic pyranopterin phosphate synthase
MPADVAAAQAGTHLDVEEIVSFVRVAGRAFGLSKVHLTGGEPLLRGDILSLIAQLAKLPVGDLVLTTNGQQLGDLAKPLRQAGLGRVNVSLDSLDPRKYGEITRGGDIKLTLEGIAQARASSLPVKINTVVMRGVNDGELVDIARWGLRSGCCVRFLELMPIGPASSLFEKLYVSSAQVKDAIGEAFDMCQLPVQAGSTMRAFRVQDVFGQKGASGTIGFISSGSRPFCQGCRRLRLTASGRLVGCLGLGLGPRVKPLLHPLDGRRQRLLTDAIHAALGQKQAGGRFTTSKLMVETGG